MSKKSSGCTRAMWGLPQYLLAGSVVASLAACGGGSSSSSVIGMPPPVAKALSCDDSMKAAFAPDSNTQVLFVKAFKQGDPLSLAATPPSNAAKATADLCLVKLRVGPGNPGPATAPSTTAGIGFEIWLPNLSTWNGRIRAEAPGAFMGSGGITSSTGIGMLSLAQFAAANNTVTVVTDGGHADGPFGTFLTLPDGSPNTFGWNEISRRAVHEMSLKTKALAAAYYTKPADKSYAYGCSSGGRAVYQSAQSYPKDYDGIVADAVSLDQTQYFPGLMYPQLVMQRDLADKGLPLLTKAKRDAVSTAALQACDTAVNGTHDGYLTYHDQCKYDPTKDAAVLCTTEGGTNATAACVTKVEALALNKMWYGATVDGSVPDPAIDNGTSIIRTSQQLWWGRKRGTDLENTAGVANNAPSLGILGLVMDQIAWNLQDLSYTRSDYINASGTGKNGWMTMPYSVYAQSFYQGKVLNDQVFANIDANNPDLTPFRDAGAKMLSFVGVADPFVSLEAQLNYYTRSAALVGGNTKAQDFHRLFLIPGRGHCGGVGSVGASSASTPQISADQMYAKIVDWVETKQAPETLPISSPDGTRSRPICMYPKRVKYLGGDVNAAASYACQQS
ncbi:tannase/feruloyl esterase family alpha/beta hydrolase [Polaromonas hydrogenivorans]|uniref:Tannase/feruloyl esterase family alpha/beta hydrolase n=1 Tax=Polaromonas hydrogenivorans TaxID=335476 RepID=A0AAU7LZI4_9BURK